jgi:ATP-dependent 26S proteasome regulatory subunit
MRRFFVQVALTSKSALSFPPCGVLSRLSQVAVPPPNAVQRASILAAVASEMQLDQKLDISALAAETEGWSGAEVAAILRDAAAAAIRENVDAQLVEARHVRMAS